VIDVAFLVDVTGVVFDAAFLVYLHAPAALAPFAFGAPFLCELPESPFFPEPSPQFERAMVSSIDEVFVWRRRTDLNAIPIIYPRNSVFFFDIKKSCRYSCYDNWNRLNVIYSSYQFVDKTEASLES
jgi:hypothetical protein